MDFLTRLFDTSDFPPRWYCGAGWLEAPWLGWLHILSDLGVWSAYVAIPAVLGYFLFFRKDLPFRRIFLLFGAFILACGTTHLMGALLFWWPAYRFDGLIKLLTAIVSWTTVFALVPIVPRVLAMRSPEELEREIAARKQAEGRLQEANDALERRIAERTVELREANATLHREREWFQTTLASIGDGVLATDLHGRITFLNQVALQLTGFTEDEALGAPLSEVFRVLDEDTQAPVSNPIDQAIREGVIVGLANHTLLVARDGTHRPIDDSAAPIRDGRKQVVGGVLVFRDVTERRRAEEAQAERVRLLALAADVNAALTQGANLRATLQGCAAALVRHLDGALVRIWILDPSENVLELQAGAGPSAIARDGVQGVPQHPLSAVALAPDGFEGVAQHPLSAEGLALDQSRIGWIARQRTPYFTRSVAEDLGLPEREAAAGAGLSAFAGYPLVVEDRLIGVLILYSRAALTEACQAALRAVAGELALDIERRRAEDALRISRQRLDLVVNGSEIGLFAWDLPLTLLVGNRKWKEHHGLPAANAERKGEDEVTAAAFDACLHPDDRARTRLRIDQAIAEDGGIDIEYRTRCPEGRVRWLRAVGRTFSDPDGTPRRFDGFTVDVTTRVEQEEALREADRRKSEFLDILSHELRNPLAPLRNGLEVLRLAGAGGAEHAGVRDMMDRQLTQMVRLVDDLLDLSRINRGKIELRRERVSLEDVVAVAVETSGPLLEAARHELVVRSTADQPLWVFGDATRLAQVVANLLNNAAKYTPEKGHIRVTLAREGNHGVIRVRDDGEGIPADKLPSIFEMFTQLRRHPERSQGGLGIGLTLVRRLVMMHGGQVDASSDGPDRGSEFVVHLPLAVDQEAGPGPMPPQRAESSASAGRRILVVDDSPDSAESLRLLLQLLGNEVRTASDGPAALQVLVDFCPEVVLLDIGLPGMTGYDVARRMRDLPQGRDALIVAQTGWGQENDRRRSREAGFNAHLVKPLDLTVLLEVLNGAKAPAERQES